MAKKRSRRNQTSPRARAERTRQQTRTIRAKDRFLQMFALCGNLSRSAQAAEVGRATVYEWLRRDSKFKEQFTEAQLDAVDRLELEAWRRGVEGWLEPVVSAGKHVTDVRRYSDKMLMLMLKARKPEVYRERFELVGKNGSHLFRPTADMTLEEMRAEAATLVAELGLKVIGADSTSI